MENLQRVEPMTEVEIVKRKIVLKRQAIPLIRAEIIEHEERFILLRMRGQLEDQITEPCDPALSAKLDCVIYLLEN